MAEHAAAPSQQAAAVTAAAPDPSRFVTAAVHGPANFKTALDQANAGLALASERVRNGPGQWLRQESLAAAQMREFSLLHDYGALADAGKMLDSAHRNAPPGSGPWLRQASFAMMTHDLASAENALDGAAAMAVPPPASDRAEMAAMRGDIALYRGDMATASARYAEAARIDPTRAFAFRGAALARFQGDFDSAIALFARSARDNAHTGEARARIALQIGVSENARGNGTRARAWYDAAETLFPGSPVTAAHRAEGMALAGDLPGAVALMETVATDYQWPEAMDALAMMYRFTGDRAQSQRWAGEAGRSWRERLRQAPLAARAHAAEHELAFGDPARALELSRANLAARPDGPSRLLMANALIANGRYRDAMRQLQTALDAGWRSAPLYAAMAQAAALAGEEDAAADAREQALAINPKIFDPETALAWFSHG